MKKPCPRCKKSKYTKSFYKNARQPSGLSSWCKECTARYNKKGRVRRPRGSVAQLRAEFLAAYGGRCTCCGEDRPLFLTLEHKNQDGAEHRRQVGKGTYNQLSDIKARGWPSEYTVYCFNCNQGTYRNKGVCPHVSP